MSYQAIPPKYEAVQLGTGPGAQDAFIATVDPTDVWHLRKSDDGSLSFQLTTVVNPGDWWLSAPYQGTFPGWEGNYGGIVAGTDFPSWYQTV